MPTSLIVFIVVVSLLLHALSCLIAINSSLKRDIEILDLIKTQGTSILEMAEVQEKIISGLKPSSK